MTDTIIKLQQQDLIKAINDNCILQFYIRLDLISELEHKLNTTIITTDFKNKYYVDLDEKFNHNPFYYTKSHHYIKIYFPQLAEFEYNSAKHKNITNEYFDSLIAKYGNIIRPDMTGLMLILRSKKQIYNNVIAKILDSNEWDPTYYDSRKNTHLIWASNNNVLPLDLFTKILEKTPNNMIGHQNIGGYTALHRSLFSKNKLAAELLIDNQYCNINACDNDGNSTLMIACYSKLDNISIKLMKHVDCKIYNINKKGKNALDIRLSGEL